MGRNIEYIVNNCIECVHFRWSRDNTTYEEHCSVTNTTFGAEWRHGHIIPDWCPFEEVYDSEL